MSDRTVLKPKLTLKLSNDDETRRSKNHFDHQRNKKTSSSLPPSPVIGSDNENVVYNLEVSE